MTDLDLAGVPRATARMQMHAGFTFADATALVPYHAALGISHLYLSPITCARPGSTHGYDVTDCTRINPELGGEEGFYTLCRTARDAGLGIVIDIVPNHMAADVTHNGWWRDVLANGRDSRYAHHFDIDWDSRDPALAGKVHVPILGERYWDTLKSGALSIERDAEGHAVLRYGEQTLPLADSPSMTADTPDTPDKPDAPDTPEAWNALLERQHYRLAWWRTAAAELNWRRFFEITELVGLRQEREEVFEDTHALVFRLYREGWIDGVRIDHVDGLADPAGYCRQLRARLDALRPGRPGEQARMHPWIVIEKILGEDEPLRADWQTDGTTGYDFMNDVAAVLHHKRGEATLDALWHEIGHDTRDYPAQVRAGRERILDRHLMTEFGGACGRLYARVRATPELRDITLAALRHALHALLLQIPVYRTYYVGAAAGASDGASPDPAGTAADDALLDAAAERARATLLGDEQVALDLIVASLRDSSPIGTPAGDLRTKLQQIMPALAAKGGEDTAFYRYGRLLSRNEVGSDPGVLAISPEHFFARLLARPRHAMLATATHDHKRGEDARMRLAVLSELADEWRAAVEAWEARMAPVLAASPKGPDGVDRMMLYQTLLGAWPADPRTLASEGAQRDLVDRVLAWQTKSIREAKRHGSWTDPDPQYEAACEAFVAALGAGEADGVLERIGQFAHRLGPAAALNSLSQTLLQLTAPGVPDRYQGTETWDFSLVDPDNRRAPDYERLRAQCECTAGWSHWLQHWRDGRIKQQLIRAVLQFRRGQEMLFTAGTCEPVVASGDMASHVLAFSRQCGGLETITVVTRHAARHVEPDLPRIPAQCWGDTALRARDGGAWVDVLTGRTIAVHAGHLRIRDVLHQLPVALLARG
ncbi:malto-oligosyltrehalose synthase [Cupriavidus plantarum]|uniref:Maltooligosyl trehalose synthase n=1 Tax=Cupriavidus plantarum TaxID=942865 RepID=A0A316EWC3_9BURK|nr:malto-oligosyltrehalose synthase [Cupriavidus plantarum]PWK35468.1 maltooligosyl trehalose synthase [Cupriavidus plantarum]